MNAKTIHDEHTKTIQLKPQIIGIEGIVLSTGEVNLFKKSIVISQPDNLLINPDTKIIYNIEYKCHDNNSQANHAIYQLKRAEGLLKRIFPDYKTINLYIHDDYKIEVLK